MKITEYTSSDAEEKKNMNKVKKFEIAMSQFIAE